MSEMKWVLNASDPKKVTVLLNGEVNRILDVQHPSFEKNKSELINEIQYFGGESNVIVTIGYKKLLEMEKRQQKLEDEMASHGPEGRNYTNGQYVDLLLKFNRLEEQVEQAVRVLEDIKLGLPQARQDDRISNGFYNELEGMIDLVLSSLSQGTDYSHEKEEELNGRL